MIEVDVTRHLDPEMAAAVAESNRLYGEIVAKRGPVAPDDLAGQRASYNHERAFWNARPCMRECKGEVRVLNRARTLDVTPQE